MTPSDLERRYGVSAKTLRAYLRGRWPHEPGARWFLSDAQIDDVRDHFGLHTHGTEHRHEARPVDSVGLDASTGGRGREPERLLDTIGVRQTGVCRWGDAVPLDAPGAYLVEVPSTGLHPRDEIAMNRVCELLDRRPELRIHGCRPTAVELRDHLASMWVPDTTIVYIGLAGTSVRRRVRQYVTTRIGASGPHAGGWPLKMLTHLADCHVTYAACDDPKIAERRLLDTFSQRRAPDGFIDPKCVIPFANLDHPGNRRQRHGVTGACAPR